MKGRQGDEKKKEERQMIISTEHLLKIIQSESFKEITVQLRRKKSRQKVRAVNLKKWNREYSEF